MKLTITNFLAVWAAGLGLSGCGGLSSEQLLSVEMYGVSKMPEGATGTRDPKFQIYQLLKVDIVSEDGATTTNLFDNEEEKIFRIVDREQLIYSKKITDLVDTSYGSMLLTFAPEVTGGDSEENTLAFTLANPVLTLTQPFAIEKAKDIAVIIKMNWGNTLTDEAMTEPTFVLTLD
ncbi:MAG TPA: hypothetical protein VFO10_08120 [Oligoflexus sp.]|uniref:hypothetical protein n=1 Tax=Oligoflexus sp. TaxID=1971216 RepID=UPI002D7ED41D|nr:hypothetical protein [Oligoflexus sp.]HET9237202.1 hypothetical protein [Oligoflexus sp.]